MRKSGVIDKSVKPRTLGSRIFKYFLIGIGSVVLLFVVFAAWIYFSIIAGPDLMEISDFHPFKSLQDKTQYLALENKMAIKWPVVSEEKTVRTSYGQTFMRISGPENGQPLILLPGGGANSLIWKANIEALSTTYRTYALDNIYDFGRSVFTRKLETSIDYSQWLDELFDTLSLENNIRIIGYSYGGWVTGIYAIHHPERLDRVILIAPAFLIQPITKDSIWRMFLGVLPSKYCIRSSIYWIWDDLVNNSKKGKEIADERVEYVYTALKSFKFKIGVEPITLDDTDLKKLNMPVLFLIGEHEKVCNPKLVIDRLNKVAPKIKIELISGTGHDLMFTHTDKVNNAMLDFLK